ncbi:hypothetical protein DEFDS_P171 (plasmid) [Deferribacter desulfuricans SSM1]|uniref:Uncharacterized protein n=1 Tax=Deferribacter desulfuricans (strain DSM 14783 / JCM 11476 / NBRC 101012 / SSM1) TaxID=639282 RepID=D3PEZ9_DEFDS|nr:hypothetical protein [Deferribacter desulfuricans]BAI81791.1 hypothetical protein DEFDS_P171 [Deferribacter desulfuricans SSM1]
MSKYKNLNPKDLYDISISNLYNYIYEIMENFNYAFHQSVKEIPGKTICEIWKAKHSTKEVLVWIEVVQDGQEVDSDLPITILRIMNDYNLKNLFFFTNGYLNNETKQLLDEENYFIFTTDEIIETLLAIDKKKITKVKSKRKKTKVPSGFILIKNYLKNREIPKHRTIIKLGLINNIINKYLALHKPIYQLIQHIENYENVPDDIEKKLKMLQFNLLPYLLVISSYKFITPFSYLKVDLFEYIKYLIMYIGAVIEYEPLEDVERYKNQIDDYINKFNNIDKEIEKYRSEYLELNKKLAKNLLIQAVTVMLGLFIIGLYILLKK